MTHFDELRRDGAMSWHAEEHAWVGDPDGIMRALRGDGFEEYKCEVATGLPTHARTGGIWQGLDPRTGTVATIIWVVVGAAGEAHVFVEIDGRRIEGSEAPGAAA